MKKIIVISTILAPQIMFAQAQIPDFRSLVNHVISFLPSILSIIALIVFLYFVWRVAQFILEADSSEGRKAGQRAIVWGIFALFIIATLTAIIQIVLGELSLGQLILPQLPE